MKKKIAIIGSVIALAIFAGACSEATGNASRDARNNDENNSAQALVQLQQAQPTPKFDWSQIRQNLIEIQTSQATTTATTTFFFLEGVENPIDWCPSIGAPIATTSQLTNPEQMEAHNGNPYTLPQVEVTGIYTGQSSGTYVICIDASGEAYANYWEGYTKTVFGPAIWDEESGQIKLTGKPSFDFSESR